MVERGLREGSAGDRGGGRGAEKKKERKKKKKKRYPSPHDGCAEGDEEACAEVERDSNRQMRAPSSPDPVAKWLLSGLMPTLMTAGRGERRVGSDGHVLLTTRERGKRERERERETDSEAESEK